MKPKSRIQRSSFLPSQITMSLGLAVAGLAIQSAQAASQTWLNTGSNANWSDTGNWVGAAAPGDTSILTNTDVATFNSAVGTVGSVGTPIIIDSATQNLGGISFGTAAGNFFVGSTGGNSLLLSNGGSIQILSSLTATNALETLNAPLVLEGAGGSYSFTNSSANGSGAGAGTLSLGGPISGGTAGASILTLGGTNTNTNTVSGAISNGTATTVAVTKSGAGTWVLTGTNTYTGATTLNAGTLNLGGGTATGSISSTSALALGGGTLSYTRSGGTTQTFASTAINAGASAISAVAGDTLALGAITQAVGGTVDFGTTGTLTTSAANVNGILGGWATNNNSGAVNLNGDWVANNGSGTIITYAGYTTVSGAAATGTGSAAQNWRNTANTSIAASTTINSLNQQADFSIASGATLTLNSGGLMLHGIARWMTNNGAGNLTGTGKLTTGLATGELFLHVPDSAATNWTIWPVIADGAVASQLVKDGPGVVYLENYNTYTGGTTVNGGTLRLEHYAANSGTGVIRGTLTINSAGTVVASGAYANTLGYTAGAYVNVMNVNGGLFSDIVVGDQGYAITYNLKGGTIQSNSGTSSNSTTQLLVFGGASTVNVLASPTTSTIAGRAALRDSLTNFNVADGPAATDLLVSAAITGAFNLTKTGLGTMVLSGANTHTGTTFLSGGNTQLTGSITGASLSVGNLSATPAAMYQTGNITTGSNGLRIGQLAGAVGYYKLTSGALTLPAGGEVDPGGSGGGAGTFGQFDMVGGSVGGGDYLLPNRGAAGEASVTNISASTFTIPATLADGPFNGLSANWTSTGAAQTAAITIGSGGQFISQSVRVKLNQGLNYNGLTGNSANVTALNLTGGGLLQTLGFLNGTSPNASINLNNGTLKAGNAANAAFLANLGSVNVYSGNATIDNNGQAIAIAQPFLAASGTGVSAVPVASAGSGYITPPQVIFSGGTLSGGSGSAATGYATLDPATGAVTGIVVTNPGTYSDTTGLSVALTGVTGSGASLGAISLNAGNTSGGITFQGTGTTTLSGTSTYTGASTITGGGLTLSGSGSIDSSSAITINGSGAKFSQTSSVAVSPIVTLTQGTVDGLGGAINTLNVGNSAANILTAGNGTGTGTLSIGALTFNGAATVNLGFNSGVSGTNIDTTTLATHAAGTVTVHVSNTGTGLWTLGTYPLIGYTGGSIAGNGFASFALATVTGLGGRQSAALVDTGSAVALSIAGDAPMWTGLVGGVWSTTSQAGLFNWKMQTAGTGTEFQANDTVLFDDTATGITDLTINDASVSPTSTVFNNSTLNYSLSGANGINTGSLTKSGSASLTINNANSYSGGTTLDGGTLNLNNNSAIGTGPLVINGGAIDNTSGAAKTLAGNNTQTWNANIAFGGSNNLDLGTGAVTMTASRTVTTGGTSVLAAGGGVSGIGFGLTKTGSGTLTLGGANTYTGNTAVNAGVLDLAGTSSMTGGLFVNGGGTLTLAGTFGTSAVNNTFSVGFLGGKGILNILPSVTITRANLFVGDSYGVAGAVYQTGGAVVLTQAAGIDNFRIGSAASGTGYYQLSNGTLTVNEAGIGASLADTTGVMDVTGGTFTDNGWITVGRGGATSSGVLNVTGGAVRFGATAANPLSLNWAATSGAASVFNVGGGAAAATVTGASTATAGKGLNLAGANTAGTVGVANLLTNGTLTVNEVTVGNAAPTALLNFHGGTLKATAVNRGANFMVSANMDGVFVYGAGGTIDNSATSITISNALLAPTVGSGNGVNGIDSFTGGAGYIGAPMVKVVPDVSDTTGIGATAVATVDPASGVVTGITITNPGVGYTATPTFTLTGGGATIAATVTGTAPTANTSGGLTFSGTGFTTLSGANTYTGGSTVNGGSLQIAADAQLGAIPAAPAVNVTLNGGALYNNATSPVLDANRVIDLAAGGGYLQAGWAPDTLTVNGLITGSGGLGINWDGGAVILTAVNSYTGNTTIGTAGPGYWTNVAANPILKLGIDNALPEGAGFGNVVFGTSANSNTATLDLNEHSAQINGLSGGTNAIIDNTAGIGGYDLTVGDNDQTSTFAGVIRNTSGTLLLTKIGTGTLTLSGASTFGGGTRLSDGILVIGLDSVGSVAAITSSAVGKGTLTLAGGRLTNLASSGNKTLYNAIQTTTSTSTEVRAATGTDFVLAGPLSGSGNVDLAGILDGAGLRLEGDNSGFTGSVYVSGVNVRITSGAGSAAAAWTVDGGLQLNEVTANTFNLGSLDGAGNIGSHVSAATQTLSIGALGTDTTFSGIIADMNAAAGNLDGAAGSTIGLTKTGSGTLTLTGANTYSGTTTVNGGVLSLTSAFLADGSAVSIGASGVLNLDYVGTDVVGALKLAGVAQPNGIYDSANSGGRITGPGKIQVLAPPVSYASWAALNAPGQTPDQDYNGDGVMNGIAYFMGASGSSFTANPGVVGGTVTWPKSASFSGSYAVQTSPDLVTWTDVTLGVADNGSSVVYTMPSGPTQLFVRLDVTPAP